MPRTDVILIGANGWTDRADKLEHTGRHTVLGYCKEWWKDVTFYHRDGHAYTMREVRPARRVSAVDRVLAYTFYNPFMEFAYEYSRGPTYALGQLRQTVKSAIEKDGDILTQFHKPSELLAKLEQAASFDDVSAVLELAETPDDAT